ncbi:MAG: E2/UBC family protein [Verrucomicrobiales bacterium]|nr:E2/UBC family protein [Verrucomicrobiales bacterium]
MNKEHIKEGHGDAVAEHAQNCHPAPKRAIVVNDQLLPMPNRFVKVAAIKEQASIPKDHALIRDHNSPHDVIMPENGTADLAEGTVFYSVPACEVKPRPVCDAPAKRVVDVGDRWEVVTKPDQTGRTIRDLFDLSDEVELLKDFKSPNDEVISDDTAIDLREGEVFLTQKRKDLLTIIVNKKKFNSTQGVKKEMTGLEIATLVYDKPENTVVSKINKDGTETEIALGSKVKIHECDEFKVIRKDVNAGFQSSRIEHELAQLRENGVNVTLLAEPVPAVVYIGMPVKPGHPAGSSDVLVKVPGGYPATFIDCAYLPEGSPLQGRVPGAFQGIETIGGRRWQHVSIHPYTGNGAVWDKDRHGFHTYFDEMLSWLNKAN